MSRHSNFGHSILLEACSGNVCVLLCPVVESLGLSKKKKKKHSTLLTSHTITFMVPKPNSLV